MLSKLQVYCILTGILCTISFVSVSQINQSNKIDSIGNIGIGTLFPDSSKSLEVVGNSLFRGKVEIDSLIYFNDSLLLKSMRADDDVLLERNLIFNQYKNTSAGSFRNIGVAATGEVVLMPGPSNCSNDLMYWQSTEPLKTWFNCSFGDVFVGIGTNDPQYALEVYGDQYLSGNLGIGVQNPLGKFHVGGNAIFDGNMGIGETNPLFNLHINGNALISESLYIGVENSNIGIGAYQDPVLDVEVLETATSSYDKISSRFFMCNSSGTDVNELIFVPKLQNSSFNWHTKTDDIGIFWNSYNSTSGLVIAPHDGSWAGLRITNRGISTGISEPEMRFHVENGGIKISGNNGVDGDTRLIIENTSASEHFIRFSNGAGDQLFVDNEGKLFAHEVEVKVGNFPDYVFKDDYRLMSLKELDRFIKQYSHLPEVPTEKTVLEEGLNLGDMDVVLLKKIEELTLYTIEQQKLIEELQHKIDKIKQN